MAGRLRVLHLIGIDDSKRVTVTRLAPDMARLKLHATGNVEVRSLLGDDVEVVSFLCGELPGEPLQTRPVDVVFNAICDPDTNAGSLREATHIVGALGVPVLNEPTLVASLTRARVAETLEGIDGLRVPRTIRIAPRRVRDVPALVSANGIDGPYLVREAGLHGGRNLVPVHGPDDVDELERFALDGRSFYVSEFVDFSSADGLYRKYRTIVVGGEPVPKHLIASAGWNVHAQDRVPAADAPTLQAEDDEFVTSMSPHLERVFRDVHERLGLDYFGVDFGIDRDGEVVLFEANCCVRALAGGAAESEIPSHRRSTERIRDALRRRLHEVAGRPA